MYVLIIEDSPDLAANIGEYLEDRGHIVDYAGDGISGYNLATTNHYDALVLDLYLPGMDGLAVCQRLRESAHSAMPVLMLTARDQERDKLAGFEAGADDYLTKPFSLAELTARLTALIRRSQGMKPAKLRVHNLEFDCQTLQATRGKRRLELTPTGLKLLEHFMRVHPAVVTRSDMERLLWGDNPPDNDATLRAHIHALRSAIDNDESVKLLHTVHGIGYRLEDGSGQ
ncbi:MAG TPA: response regulator transcription factor [Fluviicoccus sp.]|nr:response regulator transcription factor [Fluviicoccus sp.]